VIAGDARWSWRHLELWAEVFAARFQVPFACRGCGTHTDDADSLAWYVEGRYRLTPNLFAALRWNQQVFANVDRPGGGELSSDRDAWRTDMAVTYRFDRHVQAKLQYAIGRQTGSLQQGEQLVAVQMTIRF
jgi:predicted porin